MEGDTLSVTQSLFTGSGSRCWLPRTTHAMHYPHSGARVPSNRPQRLTTCLINGSSPTLWEIRVMKSDSGVHADPLHLVYFSRRWGARLRSEKAANILILEGGEFVSPSGILMNQNGHLASCRCTCTRSLSPLVDGKDFISQ